MDIGKIIKVIYVPMPDETRAPARENPEEKPIRVDNWPIRVPIKEPAEAE